MTTERTTTLREELSRKVRLFMTVNGPIVGKLVDIVGQLDMYYYVVEDPRNMQMIPNPKQQNSVQISFSPLMFRPDKLEILVQHVAWLQELPMEVCEGYFQSVSPIAIAPPGMGRMI